MVSAYINMSAYESYLLLRGLRSRLPHSTNNYKHVSVHISGRLNDTHISRKSAMVRRTDPSNFELGDRL